MPTTVVRGDVGAVFPGRGDTHGFEQVVPAAPGTHQVCASVPNEGATGTTLSLGCRTITVLGGVPFGNVDAVTRGAGTARIAGLVDRSRHHRPGAGPRLRERRVGGRRPTPTPSAPTSGSAYPGYGIAHGIDLTVAVPVGGRRRVRLRHRRRLGPGQPVARVPAGVTWGPPEGPC